MDKFFEDINFPYSSVRVGQDDFIKKVYKTISECRNIMVSAPTGLGKTVSALAPAINIAKKKGLTVVCLTSRQTQANQIIKTIQDINTKANYNDKLNFVAFIGKRSMCSHKDRDTLPASDFNDFCKKMKETGKCSYYKNTKNSDYEEKIKGIIDETSKNFMTVENFVKFVSSPTYINENLVKGFCPYELAGKKAFKADVVVCDFNYLFSTGIREAFLGKIGRTLDECIVIVDEAHNLPDRVRNSHSFMMNNDLIKNATKEMRDFVKTDKYDQYILNLRIALNDIYHDKLLGEKSEYLISKKEFLDSYLKKISKDKDGNLVSIKDIVSKLKDLEAIVKEDRVISFIGRVASFLEQWNNLDEEYYLRTMEKQIREDKTVLTLRIKCIDPSEISSEIINNTYSSILMSATLSPIEMYKDILGVANCETLEISSPFSKERQLTLVMDNVTSKYSSRSPTMFAKIADNVEGLLTSMYGKNAIIFFPSYDFMDRVLQNISIIKLERKVLKEKRYMTKDEKEKFVGDFKSSYSTKAKVLFAVTSGSFSEGLDLPNDALECVGIIGLPLSMPDIFTQAVIRHFDKKFGKGQLYGYIHPAMSKIIQAAGRCIRTETDKGVIALMDNRFMWPLYAQIFPKSWKIQKSKNFKLEIGEFYSTKDPMNF